MSLFRRPHLVEGAALAAAQAAADGAHAVAHGREHVAQGLPVQQARACFAQVQTKSGKSAQTAPYVGSLLRCTAMLL